MNPATLADIVREGIVSRMDMDVYRQAVQREEADKSSLVSLSDHLDAWVAGV